MADHFADFRSKKINFPSASFDAAYAIEATVHAPSLEAVYSQIFRVLKPGGVFGVYEWVMTDAYDESNEHHRKIRLGIERGNGIAMKKAGFVVEHEEDLAQRKVSPIADRRPWYAPLAGDLAVAQTLGDFFGVLRMSSIGRMGVGVLLRTMETLRLAPLGSAETAAELSAGADALVAGGKEGLFTPMYLMVARKPVPGDV
jgi:sterol 24-C-methyltransferase